MAATKVAKRKPQGRPAEDSAAFGPIAERFRRAGDLERAVSLCRDGLQRFPETISARVTLGWALLELGKFNDARAELEAVLRRAPDNLSAIRGLAELHDRSEHTMDLPMDGPGQWPPDAAAVDRLDQTVATADESAAGDIVDEAVWVPVRDGHEPDESSGLQSAVPAHAAPPELGLAMWSAVDAADVASASGMSSVREIDPNPPASTFEQLATEFVVAEPQVDLAALIPETDSLEAVADVMARDQDQGDVESVEPAIVLEAGVDLSAFEETEAVGLVELTAGQDAAVELVAGFDAPVDLTTGYDAPVELTAGSDLPVEPELAVPAAFVDQESDLLAPAALVQSEPEPELIVAPTVEVLTAAFEAEEDPGPRFELTAPDESAPSWSLAELAAAEAFRDADAATMAAEAVEVAQVLDFESAPPPELAPEPVVAATLADVVAFVKVVEPAPRERSRSAVASLERLLAGVHARRRQLMAESVA